MRVVTTRTSTAPTGKGWQLKAVRPLTGLPVDADGRLLLSYEWHQFKSPATPSSASTPPPTPPPSSSSTNRRGLVQTSLQGEMFAQPHTGQTRRHGTKGNPPHP